MTGHWAIAALLMAAQTQGSAALPAWIEGGWCTTGSALDKTCELWSAEGGEMRGASITIRQGATAEFEDLRIRMVDGMPVYLASPNGGAAVEFRAIARDANSITFANDAHDYPQRIRYWREGEKLLAEISLKDGSKAMRWEYRPASDREIPVRVAIDPAP